MDLRKIIEGCKRQNPKAQKTLYDMFSKKLFGLCLRYCKNREDAKDVLQETFIKVFNKIDMYEPIAPFEVWIRRICINNALNMYRGTYQNVFNISINDMDIPMEDENEFDALMENISIKRILEAIEILSPQQRAVFNLIEIEEYSCKNAAELLNITSESVRVHNFRAKKRLREILKDLR